MKKLLSVVLTLVFVCSLMSGITVFAEAVPVEVTADESWENAAYDPDTGVLTNVSEGYSFPVTLDSGKATFEIGSAAAADTFTVSKVVIPYSFTYDAVTYTLASMGKYILGNGNESVTEVVVSEGITEISTYAFSNLKGAVSIELPATLKKIEERAFQGASALSEITLPDGLEKIENRAFHSTGITSITIPASVTSLDTTFLFYGCQQLETIDIQCSYTKIGEQAFRKTKIKSFTIPEGVTSIGKLAFGETAISEIIVPASVTSIGEQAFASCKNLKTVTVQGSPKFNKNVFSGITGSIDKIIFEGEQAPTLASGASLPTAPAYEYPANGIGYDELLANMENKTPIGGEEPAPAVFTFKNSAGDEIDTLVPADGVKVETTQTGTLVLAAYADDTLIAVKTSVNGSAELEAASIANADSVKAFILESLSTAKPLADSAGISVQ